jgi:hypothetical protein
VPVAALSFATRRLAALLPMAATVLWVYVGSVLWSMRISVSSSRTLPIRDFVGMKQYARLFDTSAGRSRCRTWRVRRAVHRRLPGHRLPAGGLHRPARAGEGLLRTVFLYPYAMSFVATGLVWQWMLNPELGLQATVRGWGFPNFTFDWIVRQDAVMYAIVVAAVWQACGLVMALMLAGLRGIDESLWMAARIDGIPRVARLREHRAADAGAVVRHRVRAAVGERGEGVRRGRGDDAGRPRPGQRGAGQVHHRQPAGARQHRARLGGVDGAAADGAGACWRRGSTSARTRHAAPRARGARAARERAATGRPHERASAHRAAASAPTAGARGLVAAT